MKNKVTEAKITDLHFDDKNANKHTQKGLRLVEKSLSKLGAGRSILIDKNNNIIAGNGVIETAGQIGMENIRIVETDGKEIVAVKRTDIDINSKKGRELAIIDNHSAKESIDLDFDVINDLVTEYDISPVEWELESIDWNNEEATEDNFEIPDKIETNIKRGDVFNIYKEGKLLHRVMCGDSTSSDDVAKLMNGEKADMVFTDPPYGVDYSAKNEFLNKFDEGNRIQINIKGDTPEVDIQLLWEKSFTNIRNMLKKGASFYITFSGDKLLLLLQILKDVKLPERQILVWVKNNHVLGRSTYQYKHEMILFGWKDGASHKFYSNFDTTVWEFNKPLKSDLHPTMKPVELVTKAITNSSSKDDIILDLFLGSGTTMVAAHQLGRRCYGMEIDERYCQVILDRIKNLDNSIEIK